MIPDVGTDVSLRKKKDGVITQVFNKIGTTSSYNEQVVLPTAINTNHTSAFFDARQLTGGAM